MADILFITNKQLKFSNTHTPNLARTHTFTHRSRRHPWITMRMTQCGKLRFVWNGLLCALISSLPLPFSSCPLNFFVRCAIKQRELHAACGHLHIHNLISPHSRICGWCGCGEHTDTCILRTIGCPNRHRVCDRGVPARRARRVHSQSLHQYETAGEKKEEKTPTHYRRYDCSRIAFHLLPLPVVSSCMLAPGFKLR